MTAVLGADKATSAELSSTVGVTVLQSATSAASNENIVAFIKRTAYGESVSRVVRHNIGNDSRPTPLQKILFESVIQQEKEKSKQRVAKQSLNECLTKHYVVSEAPSACSSLSTGNLTRGDVKNAKADSRNLLCRSPRAPRSSTAAFAGQETRPSPLKAGKSEVYGSKTKAFLVLWGCSQSYIREAL